MPASAGAAGPINLPARGFLRASQTSGEGTTRDRLVNLGFTKIDVILADYEGAQAFLPCLLASAALLEPACTPQPPEGYGNHIPKGGYALGGSPGIDRRTSASPPALGASFSLATKPSDWRAFR